ncbi:MAG: hypothetical protein II605_06790, partial [Paludibacteraceae bacterium]|nr:hypothetical protein [Paludibacteraceae bacterium]
LQEKMVSIAEMEGIPIQRGVYVSTSGPCYETPAEYKFFRCIGGDTVGMSVTPEVIAKLEAGIAIIKVRVVIKENDAKDYDIAEGYQARMAADLLKSYQEAVQLNRKANSDLSDEDF